MTTHEQPEDVAQPRYGLRDPSDTGGDGQPLAEDISLPVSVTPNYNTALPEEWGWRHNSSSQPNSATFHINHSDVTRAFADVLTADDSPPEAPFVVSKDIPVVIIDSLDQYWAGESRAALPLHGLRVPVSADTVPGRPGASALAPVARRNHFGAGTPGQLPHADRGADPTRAVGFIASQQFRGPVLDRPPSFCANVAATYCPCASCNASNTAVGDIGSLFTRTPAAW